MFYSYLDLNIFYQNDENGNQLKNIIIDKGLVQQAVQYLELYTPSQSFRYVRYSNRSCSNGRQTLQVRSITEYRLDVMSNFWFLSMLPGFELRRFLSMLNNPRTHYSSVINSAIFVVTWYIFNSL